MPGRDCKIRPQMSAGQKSEMQFRGSVFHILFFSSQYDTVFFTESKPSGSPECNSWQFGSDLLTEWLFLSIHGEEMGLESLDVFSCFEFQL